MYANRQIFLNNRTTTRASLRSAARINQFTHPASIHSFVLCVLNQLTPSRISDGFSKVVVLHHVLDGKVFKEDCSVCVHKFSAQFMSKVFSSVGNALMNVGDYFSAFGRFVCGISSLCFAEFDFITAKEARIVHRHTVGESGKGCETNINPHRQIVEGQGSRFHFTSKAGIPIPHRIPLYVQCFYSAFDGAMLDYFQHTNFGKEQAIVEKFKTCLRVREAIVSSTALEARIANFFSTLFHSAKIGLKSKINSCANFLQDLRVDLREFWFFNLPIWEQLNRVETCDGFLFLFPCAFTSRQSLIENPTTKLQCLQEFGSLALGWRKAKFVCFHLHTFLIFDVLLDYCKWSATNSGYEI